MRPLDAATGCLIGAVAGLAMMGVIGALSWALAEWARAAL